MAYAPDRVPERHGQDPLTYAPPAPNYPPTAPAYAPPTQTNEGRYGYGPAERTREAGRDVRDEMTREVTAGPFQFGIREGILGILGIFTILGVVLGILGFAAAFALDNVAASPGGGAAEVGAALLPALLVSLLPFMASVVLAIGCGAWAGHASRNATLGSIAGGVGALFGPILTLLITGVGFALGAGATGLDLSNVNNVAGQWGVAPGWANTIPYLFTGAGLLWLFANFLGGALTGGLVGGLLDRERSAHRREVRRSRHARRVSRY